jgi:hypothetical protein
MNDLLAFALDAHGGLERWREFSTLETHVTIGGAIWDLKQQPKLLIDKLFTIDTREERLSIAPFGGADTRSVFAHGGLSLETVDGVVIERRDDPLSSFVGQQRETPWDRMHVAYFASEALWTYLTSPFLYTYRGFETTELEPWAENGEIWRRLQVTFPDYILSHSKVQTTHFGPDGLMRRHDYTVDILGGATGANYPCDYHNVQGLMMPTRRRIYAHDDRGNKVPEPLLVSLDFSRLSFH